MNRITPFFLLLIFVFACSKSSDKTEPIAQEDDEVVLEEESDPEQENQTELFSFTINITGDYFTESFVGILYLSNELGEILNEKPLINNTLNKIELAVEGDTSYDITILTRSTDAINTETKLNTFTNVSSGDYFLESRNTNGAGDTFNLSLFNAGYPIESTNLSQIGALKSNENGGVYQQDISLSQFPGIFYGAFLNPEENVPRYSYLEDIERNFSSEIDFQNLPQIENKITVERPLLNIFEVSLQGFISNNGFREMVPVHHGYLTGNDIYFPNSIFDNYRLSAFFQCCSDYPRLFSIARYGEPANQSFEIPTYEATLVSSTMDNFSFEKATNHDFNKVIFSKPVGNIYDDVFEFYIHNIGKPSLSISKKALFDNILDGEIDSSELRFGSVRYINHSFLADDYSNYIQSVIMDRKEFPAGTSVMSTTFYPFSFN